MFMNVLVHSVNEEDRQRWAKFDEAHWFPLQPIQDVEEVAKLPEQFKMQKYILSCHSTSQSLKLDIHLTTS